MSQSFLSLNRGQFRIIDVATATSAPTADFYLQVDLTTNSPTKQDVLLAMKLFSQYIQENGFETGTRGTNLPVL